MTPTEIFRRLPADEADALLSWFAAHDRNAYRSCSSMLATRRKLRPVFVERKPRPERNLWIKDALSKAPNADLALETLQIWTLGHNEALVCEFLDALSIPHNGKGLIDDLPAEPGEEVVKAAFEKIVAAHPAISVFVYLHLFCGMSPDGWPVLKGLLAEDNRLSPEALFSKS